MVMTILPDRPDELFSSSSRRRDRAQQAKFVANYLRQAAPNEEISYSTIQAKFKFNPQKKFGRYIMSAARQILRKEGIVFDTIHNQGWKRLDEKTISMCFQKTLSSVQSRVKRGLADSNNVDFSKLSQSDMVSFASNRVCMSMVALYSSPKAYLDARSTVEKKVIGSNEYKGDLTLEAITRIVQPELNPRQKQAKVSSSHKWQ